MSSTHHVGGGVSAQITPLYTDTSHWPAKSHWVWRGRGAPLSFERPSHHVDVFTIKWPDGLVYFDPQPGVSFQDRRAALQSVQIGSSWSSHAKIRRLKAYI